MSTIVDMKGFSNNQECMAFLTKVRDLYEHHKNVLKTEGYTLVQALKDACFTTETAYEYDLAFLANRVTVERSFKRVTIDC